MARDLRKALHRTTRVVTRPLRAAQGRGGITVQAYRGYGSRRKVFLTGRVYQQPGRGPATRGAGLWRDFTSLLKLFLRRGVRGAVLTARFGGAEQEVVTDRHGYFRVLMDLPSAPAADRRWHRMEIELRRPAAGVVAEGEIFMPPTEARYVVISDIDDTVMETGVAKKLRMFWRLFLAEAQSRVAFPGVAALYRALHRGASGDECNPMLYVSRGPWSIYEMLAEFFELHGIPPGPLLFLREWGLTLQHPLPHRAEDHKVELIREMVEFYADLPFILIGDNGQHDPEIYTQIVEERPGRVLAVYVRNVSRDPERLTAIEGLAKRVVEAGSGLVLAADSFSMAEHAHEHGWISGEGLAEVMRERRDEQVEPSMEPTRRVSAAGRKETEEAVERGQVSEAVEGGTGAERAPNVVVEPEGEGAAERGKRDA